MTLHFGLTKYLLLCAFVDRASLVPVPESANFSNSGSLIDSQNPVIERQIDFHQNPRPFGYVNTYITSLLDDVVIVKDRNAALHRSYAKRQQANHESNRNGVADSTREVPRRDIETYLNTDERKSLSAEKQEDTDIPTPFISVPFTAVVAVTQDNAREPKETGFQEPRDPPDAFAPCFDKKHSRREIPGNPEFSTKSEDNGQKHEITGPVGLLQMLGLKTKTAHDDPLEETDPDMDSKSENHSTECMESPIIEFEDPLSIEENPQAEVNETSEKQLLGGDTGSLGSLADLLPIVLPIITDLSDPNSNTDLVTVLADSIPLLGGFLGNEGGGLVNMIRTYLTRLLGGANGEGLNIFELAMSFIGPALRAAVPFIESVGVPVANAILNIISSEDGLSSIIKTIADSLTQVDADGNSPFIDAFVDIALMVFKDLRPGEPGGLDVAAIVEAATSGFVTGTFAASESSTGYGESPQPYGSYGPYGTGPVAAASDNIRRTSPENVVSRRKTNPFLRESSPKKGRLPSVTPISLPANNVKHRRMGDRTTRRPYIKLTPGFSPNTSPLFQNFGQYHVPGPVPAGDGSGGSSYLPYGNSGVPAYGVNPLGLIFSSLKDILGDGIQLISTLINSVFGISGASSAGTPQGSSYGPPPYRAGTKSA